jgi:hypothetical protein
MHPLASGFIGAAALTGIHQAGRQLIDAPPRMDVVGMRALTRLYEACGCEPPSADRLYRMTMAGDLVSNGIYYAGVRGRGAALWGRALALGLAAGVGAVTLPEPLGLGTPPNNEHLRTRLLTVGWYVAGALAAALATQASRRRRLSH